MANRNFFAQLQAIEVTAQKLPRIIGVVAVDFSMDRFRAQNWIDSGTQNWPKRKENAKWGRTPRNRGRALLINKGRLRRSIHLSATTAESITISVEAPYAIVHNEGFKGTINQSVGAHTRTRKKGRTRTTYNVKAHNRTIRQNIPQRRFLGNSQYLTKKIEREIIAQFMKALR